MLTRWLCLLWPPVLLCMVMNLAEAESQGDQKGAPQPAAPAGPPSAGEGAVIHEPEADKEALAKEELFQSLFVRGPYTIIPLPAFAYNRNEGYWVGGLVPILKANAKGELQDIFAPQYLHNQSVGETLTMNYYGYRSDTAQYSAVASYSTKIQRDFDFSYRDLGAGGGRYILAARATWFKNAFRRFFGIGNGAPESNETNYTSRETIVQLTAGINLNPDMAVTLTEEYHDVRIEQGAVTSLPQTKEVFTHITGLGGANVFGHKLTFFYDTRDKQLIPTHGTYFNVSMELNQNLHHREPNRWLRTTVEAKQLIPHADNRMVFVAHFLADTVNGRGVPFYMRPYLGGENTLRAFGQSRFIDDTALLVNLEERIIVRQKKFFDYLVDLEVAPFLDVGRVLSHWSPSELRELQYNPGLGIRVLARPHVVGRLDIAYGRDGSNAFVGLDYPF